MKLRRSITNCSAQTWLQQSSRLDDRSRVARVDSFSTSVVSNVSVPQFPIIHAHTRTFTFEHLVSRNNKETILEVFEVMFLN